MRSYTWKQLALLVLAGAAVLGEAVYILSLKVRTHPEDMAARLPEQIVFGRASDDIIEAGAMFTPVNDHAKPIAIIWIHGWGVNFYQPTYIGIGRELAARGYTVISANTRMHDLGNVEAWRWGKRASVTWVRCERPVHDGLKSGRQVHRARMRAVGP